MRTVVFDLDGTLADTSGDLIAAANACFRAMGVGDQLDATTDAGTALRGGRAMLKLGLERLEGGVDESVIDQYYPILLDAYESDINTHTALYPGAMAAVEGLRNSGYAVAICTNKPDYLAELLLNRLGVRNQFAALVGAFTLPVRKPDPETLFETVRRAGGDIRRSLLVGDTATDHNTARAAGVPSVLVSFGPNGASVAALEPEAMINDYNELESIVASLIG